MTRNRSMAYVALFAAFTFFGFTAPASADAYKIDPSHTFAVFTVSHLGFSTTHGRFNDISGQFTEDGDGGSIEISIKAGSIDTNDAKRDKHLRSPDFFNVKQFPKLAFKSTSVKKGADGSITVTGEFTMHGVTKNITVKGKHVGTGKDPWGGTRSGYDLEFSLKRSDYGMNYMLPGVGEDVKIMVSVEGIKQ